MPTLQVKRVIKRKEFDFRQAVALSAKQNFDRDVRNHKCSNDDWVKQEKTYLTEARALLLRDGCNKQPIAPDTDHICVKQ